MSVFFTSTSSQQNNFIFYQTHREMAHFLLKQNTETCLRIIMKTIARILAAAALVSSSSLFAATVPVYNFPAPALPYAVQYGDFYSYSMPVLSWASTSMGGPAYNFNTANTIQDSLVIGTGAQTNNQDLGLIGTVANGFDFPNVAKNTTANWSTTTAESTRTTWNISLGALQDYLTFDGIQHDMVAYFNNNQTGDNPNLWAWAEISLLKADGSGTTDFYLRNTASGSPTAFGHGDYVFSGHEVTLCFNSTTQIPANIIKCDGSQGEVKSTKDFVHNLGQNDVGYGIFSQALDDLIWSSDYTEMQVRVDFMGLNNGFENLFIGAACVNGGCRSVDVPEPGMLSLLALALLGMAGFTRRSASMRKDS